VGDIRGSEGESGGPRGEAAKTRHGKRSGPSWPALSDCEQVQGDAYEPTRHRAGTERRSQGRNTDDPTNGAFGFVQNAVNSLTSAPAKFNGVHRQLTSLSHRCDVVTPSLTRRSWVIGWRAIFFQSCLSYPNMNRRAAMSGRLGMNKGRLTSLVRLSYLGPEIVRALLAGSQANALTPLRLSKNLPHDWKEQRCFLGFAA